MPSFRVASSYGDGSGQSTNRGCGKILVHYLSRSRFGRHLPSLLLPVLDVGVLQKVLKDAYPNRVKFEAPEDVETNSLSVFIG
jgi:hypothetical protein